MGGPVLLLEKSSGKGQIRCFIIEIMLKTDVADLRMDKIELLVVVKSLQN
jgi:hypothetical protein